MSGKLHRVVTVLFLAPFLCAGALAAPAPAAAPGGQAAPAGPPPKRFSLSVKNEVARTTLARVGELTGELVLADSTVRGALTADWKDVTAEEALADACKQLNVSWKRVYLPPGAQQNPDKVSQVFRSLRTVQASGLIALDPATGRASMLVSNAALPRAVAAAMEQPDSTLRRGYLVLNEQMPLDPQAAAAEENALWQPGQPLTPDKLARLQHDIFAALTQMAPDERTAAIQAATAAQLAAFTQNPDLLSSFVKDSAGVRALFLAQNPDAMRTLVQSGLQGQIEAVQQMNPEQRQTLMKAQISLFRSLPQQLGQLFVLMRGGQ